MGLTVYPVQLVHEDGKDEILGVFGSANKAFALAVENLQSRGLEEKEAKNLLEDASLKTRLRKGEGILIQDVLIKKTPLL